MEKKLDKDGRELRKQQQFRSFGVEVVDARVMHIDPTPQYQERMVLVQKALAELAVARQNRLKEQLYGLLPMKPVDPRCDAGKNEPSDHH
ncbi:SPFH domain-containing protein [Pseudomonas sp. LR_7]|uniref:SPFH domain-containing protein n=1 Tax=Pseudomonas sp. LR_7 TaxID=3055786 RepID=UPI00366A78CA